MWQLRFRLRSLLVFLLTAISFSFFITLNTLIRSNNELESQSDLGISKDRVFLSQSNVNPIDKLYEKVIHQNEQTTASSNTDRWKLKNFFVLHSFVSKTNDTNSHIDTFDSALALKESSTFPTVIINETDRIQLRSYIRQRINLWKNKHDRDPIVSLAEIMHESLVQDEPGRLNTSWYQCMKSVTNRRVYEPKSPEWKLLINHLRNNLVFHASEMPQGTQIKLILDLADGFQALLKPYRVPRNYQTAPDHFYFTDIERHHAEIGAFHVDKILGFNRVPTVVGRVMNITGDIRLKATEALANTFFISPANNTCFRGHCSYYCDTSHAVCGKPGDRLEASIQILLPRSPEINWQKLAHPFRRSYSATRKAKWETNENFCYEHVLIDEDYHTRLLLDMMDLSAFDFLIGNLDRHHMMRITSFGLNTALIHLDNGRAFGRHDSDDLSILAPIRQCCFFRSSTFSRLYRLSREGLSKLVAQSLANDEILPAILIEEQLNALDRRLTVLFSHLEKCIETYSVSEVIFDDGVD